MRTTTILAPALLLALATAVGCAGAANPVLRRAGRDGASLQRAVDAGSATPAQTARLAALVYVVSADRQAEAALLDRAGTAAPDDPAVAWRLARRASRERDYQELLRWSLRLLDADPDGWRTELAWRLVAANAAEIPGLDDVVDGWLETGPAVTATATRDVILGLLQERLAASGRREEAVALLADQGIVRRWRMAGPAGDDPMTDFLELPELDAGDAVTVALQMPFVPLVPTRSGGGVYDAWADVDAREGGRMLVSAAASCSVRVWIDGTEALTIDRWRRFADRTRYAVVTLAPGSHAVRVRLGSDLAQGSFSLRLTPLAGPPGTDPTLTDLDAIPGGAVDELRRLVAADPLDVEARLDLVLAEALTGVHNVGRRDATALAELLPASAETHRRAGLSILADTALADGTRGLLGVPHLREALRYDPELASVETMLAGRYRQQDPDAARARLEDVVRRRPDLVRARMELIHVFQDLGWTAETEAAIQDLLGRAPGRADVIGRAAGFYDAASEMARALPLRRRQLEAVGTPLSMDRARLLTTLGRLDEAIDELEQLSRLDPYDEAVWRERVRLTRALGRREEAAATARAAAEVLPSAVWPRREMAMMALARGDLEDALAWMDEALSIDPGDLDLRQERWRLGGDRARWASGDPAPPGYDPSDPSAAVAAAIAAFDADPGDTASYPTVVLMDRREVQVLPGGATIFRLHRAVRLQDRPAVDAYAELQPGELQVLAARTWRTDGTVVDADPPVEKDAYSMRDVTPGCTVEVQAMVGGRPDLGGDDGAHMGPPFLLVQPEYVRHHELIYLLPPGADYAVRGTAAPPEVTLLDDGSTRLRWEVRDQAPPEPQASAPMAEEYLPWVQVLVWTDLDESLAGLRSRLTMAVRPDPIIDDLAASLAVAGDVRATVDAVVAHVRQTIRPASSDVEQAADAVDIIASGGGSHTTATLALLLAAGVEVDPVLVRPRYLPDLGAAPRLRQDYPVVMLRVVVGGDEPDLWLELSDPYASVGWLHPVYRDAEVVALWPTTTPLPERTPAPSGALPGLDAVVTLEVDADGNARGELLLRFVAQEDALLREDLWSIAEADRLQTFDAWLARSIPGVAVTAMDLVDTDAAEGSTSLRLAVDAPGLFDRQGDGSLAAPLLIPDLLPPIDGQSSDLSSLVLGGARTVPLLVWPYHETLRIELKGPGVAGRVVEGWEPIRVVTPLIEVTRDRTTRRGSVTLTRDVTFRMGRVSADDYPTLRDLLATVVASGQSPVRIR